MSRWRWQCFRPQNTAGTCWSSALEGAPNDGALLWFCSVFIQLKEHVRFGDSEHANMRRLPRIIIIIGFGFVGKIERWIESRMEHIFRVEERRFMWIGRCLDFQPYRTRCWCSTITINIRAHSCKAASNTDEVLIGHEFMDWTRNRNKLCAQCTIQ